MNKRQAKKYNRNPKTHGYHAWEKSVSRYGNALDEHNCLRNNYRRNNGLAMFKSMKRKG